VAARAITGALRIGRGSADRSLFPTNRQRRPLFQAAGQAQSWWPPLAAGTILQRSPMIDEFLDWEAHERQQKQETKNRFVTIGV